MYVVVQKIKNLRNYNDEKYNFFKKLLSMNIKIYKKKNFKKLIFFEIVSVPYK